MAEMVSQDHLPLTRLLQIGGFLMHVVWTYQWVNPYMKGLHLTIDSWRLFHGPDGFKLRGKELENALDLGLDRDMLCCQAEDDPEEDCPQVPLMAMRKSWTGEPPVDMRPVPRFHRDLEYLKQLTEADTPPRQPAGPSIQQLCLS